MSDPLTIKHPAGSLEATFLPELGMVGSSLRHRGEELLAQRGGPEAYASRGSTFGIPLLHPWANRLAAWDYTGQRGVEIELDPESPILHADGATGLPIHGVLAASPDWQLVQTSQSRFSATLDFASREDYLEAFPFPHTLTYIAEMQGDSLQIGVTLTPGDKPVPVAFGFHPYLTLPGSDRRDWRVELPVVRRAVLDKEQIPIGATVLIEPGELDGPLGERVFDTSFPELIRTSSEPATFVVADDHRRIAVEFTAGYPVAQVYAPADSEFICFEPMTSPVNSLRSRQGLRWARPNMEFTAIFTISVR